VPVKLKEFAKKSKAVIIAFNILNNWRLRRRFSLGDIQSTYGSSHLTLDLSGSLSYINQTFHDYVSYSGLSKEAIRGARVLEIGHGDNVGVALKFLAEGAARVICLDKFYSKRSPEQEHAIYRALRETLGVEARRRFDEVVDLSDGVRFNPDKLRCMYGVGVEAADRFLAPGSSDLIVSRAVLQSVQGPDAAFRAMDRLLAPGGCMAHKIDLRDLGLFTSSGKHPLTFLTVPDFTYRLMTRDTDKPNRRLIGFYRRMLSDLEYESKLYITSLVGRGEEVLPHKVRVELNRDYTVSALSLIDEIRPRLERPFKTMADEDLLVSGIFVIARKPIQRVRRSD
jgi:SAM-dependent methyltransferase